MKKRILATVLTMAMAVTMFVTPKVVKAEVGEIIIDGITADEKKPTELHDESNQIIDNLAKETIEAEATTLGAGDKIIYKIRISWGNMKFTYRYGDTWDPDTHSYVGDSAVGWDSTELCNSADANNKNNVITVENKSNYPITVTLTSEINGNIFNSTPGADGSVMGIFYDKESPIYSNITQINTSNYEGVGATDAKTLVKKTFDLEKSDSSNRYYKALSSSTPTKKDTYYALCGTPDKGVDIKNEKVSKIQVLIKPYKE